MITALSEPTHQLVASIPSMVFSHEYASLNSEEAVHVLGVTLTQPKHPAPAQLAKGNNKHTHTHTV